MSLASYTGCPVHDIMAETIHFVISDCSTATAYRSSHKYTRMEPTCLKYLLEPKLNHSHEAREFPPVLCHSTHCELANQALLQLKSQFLRARSSINNFF